VSAYNVAKTEILDTILELGEATSYDIAELTGRSTENASVLMLRYHRWGLLSRHRGSWGYVYEITRRGIQRLEWLQS